MKTGWSCWFAATTLLVSMVAGSGCASSERKAAALSEPTQASRQEIYRRAGERFGAVALSKPLLPRGDATNSPAFELPPLIFRQLPSRRPPGNADLVHEVWFSRSAVQIGGQQREQRSYYWEERERPGVGGKRKVQGVRMTLNGAGQPVIWEILRDRSGAEVFWISQELEIAAAEQFGPALPGRLCSVERAAAEAPRLVVPNVVDDGPMPMGPMVYVRLDGDIPILACRCSPLMAGSLELEGTYRMREVTAEEARRIVEGSFGAAVAEAWWDPRRIEQRLRLPAKF